MEVLEPEVEAIRIIIIRVVKIQQAAVNMVSGLAFFKNQAYQLIAKFRHKIQQTNNREAKNQKSIQLLF